MNPMERAIERMTATVRGVAGVAAVYVQGATEIALTVVMEDALVEVDGDQGFPVQARVTDFLVRCADLVVLGQVVEPLLGDQIRLTRAGRVETYKAMRPAGGSHFEPEDPYGNTWRVHTQRVKVT
ncbi:MAG: hypothetical protein JW741_25455 [Sedimentisphaerales bacterium]|nr:hypothetical protein [Sedimentisphaerales bacterium]